MYTMNLVSNVNPEHAELLLREYGMTRQENSIVIFRPSHDYSNELSDVILGENHERRHLEYSNPCLLERPGIFWQITSPESNIELRGSRKGLSSLVRKIERKIASGELTCDSSSDLYQGRLNIMDVDRFKAIIDGPQWQCYEVMDRITSMPQLTRIIGKDYLENPKCDVEGNVIYQALKSYFLHQETGTPFEMQVVTRDSFNENEKTHQRHKSRCFEQDHSLMDSEGRLWGIYIFNESPEISEVKFKMVQGLSGVASLIRIPLDQRNYDLALPMEYSLPISGSIAI